jgi:hypothetical protein
MHVMEAIVGDVETPDAPAEIGVGPHPKPWPVGAHFDPELLAEGDRRNVVDKYRYWSLDAVVADLDTQRHPFHVAIENFQHDFNIGSVVRTANAFMANEVHIVGKKRWNRRGAMVTDRYQHVRQHPDPSALAAWARDNEILIIGIDNVPGSVPLETHSDFALIVTTPTFFGSQGVARAIAEVDEIRKSVNPQLKLAGIVVNRVRSTAEEHEYRRQELTDIYGRVTLMKPVIPERIAVQQAEGTGLPVHRIRTAGGREVADIFDGYLTTLLRKS